MKVDLDLLRKAAKMRYDHPTFCDVCGETEPPSNFYPMWAHGPNSICGLTCNDCVREQTERLAAEK